MFYLLVSKDKEQLHKDTTLFQMHMEPMVKKLEDFVESGNFPVTIPEFKNYLQVCRWPFRRLEYSFALDAFSGFIKPGMRFLDAGSGVTPFSQAIAKLGIEAEACDLNQGIVDTYYQYKMDEVYGVRVKFTQQDLTQLSYADNYFDVVTCISVLEHIPSPSDQVAVKELVRVLKPGGILVITVDFTPPLAAKPFNRFAHYFNRLAALLKQGSTRAIINTLQRKAASNESVKKGYSKMARSGNQCFEIDHLEQDIIPAIKGRLLKSNLKFSEDPTSIDANDIKDFWNIEEPLFNVQGKRLVIPAAFIVQK